MPLLFLIPLFFLIYYFLFYFLITKFNLKTPGREVDVKLFSKEDYQAKQAQEISQEVTAEQIVAALGGKDNIDSVSNCFSRLRVKIKDMGKVQPDETWLSELSANGMVRKKDSVQIVYGNRVTRIATQVKEALNIN